MPHHDTRGSRLSPRTRRFQVKCPVLYAQTINILTRHVHFPRVSFLSLFRGEGVLTPLLGQVSRRTISYESRAADLPTSPRIHPILKHLLFFLSPKPGDSRLNGQSYMPKPSKSQHGVFGSRGRLPMFAGYPIRFGIPSFMWGSDTFNDPFCIPLLASFLVTCPSLSK